MQETTTTTERKLMLVSEDQLKERYFAVQCSVCGHKGCSGDMPGGEPTGGDDFNDIYCPICLNKDISNDEIDNEPTTESEIRERELKVFIARFKHEMDNRKRYDPAGYDRFMDSELRSLHQQANGILSLT